MIEFTGRYPRYKESGHPDFRAIPAHWETRTLGRVGRFLRGKGGSKEDNQNEGVGCVRYGELYTRFEFTIRRPHTFIAPASADHYTPLQTRDVLFALSGETLDDIGASAEFLGGQGLRCGGDLGVLRPSVATVPGFLGYICRSRPVALQKSRLGTGTTVKHLSTSALRGVTIVLPPCDEQAAIVRFLNHTNHRIDAFIRGKRKLISLLTEHKLTAIAVALTAGRGPSAMPADPRLSWVGPLPKHWDLVPLKRHWQVIDCKHLTVPFVDDGFALASVREVKGFEVNLRQCKRTTLSNYKHLIEGGRRLRRGDLVYCRNVNVGSAAIVNTDEPIAMGQDVCLIRSEHQNQRFLNYVLRSHFMTRQLELILVGSTFRRINVADVRALYVMVPPRQEQDAICARLDAVMAELDRDIALAEREIALMREYRTRLISDVVTGQLDVREAAKNLPDLDVATTTIDPEPELELDDPDLDMTDD